MTVDNTRNPQIWQAVCWHTRTSGDSSVMIEVKSLSIVEQSWDVFCLTKISFFFFRNSKRLISEEHQVGSLCFSSCWLPTQSEELVSDNQLLRAQGLKPSLSFFLLFLLLLFVYLACLGFVVIVVRFFAFSPNKESRQFIMKKRKKNYNWMHFERWSGKRNKDVHHPQQRNNLFEIWRRHFMLQIRKRKNVKLSI